MIIYKVTNILNGKIYIGYTTLTIFQRWKEHCCKAINGSDFNIHQAIRKYGKENFTIEEICKCKNFKGLKRMEIFFIKKFDSMNAKKGYNMTKGGDGVGKHSESSKSKLRVVGLTLVGNKNPNYGRRWTDEMKKNMSDKKKGKPSPRKGVVLSEETKDKLRKADFHKNPEVNKRISEAAIKNHKMGVYFKA